MEHLLFTITTLLCIAFFLLFTPHCVARHIGVVHPITLRSPPRNLVGLEEAMKTRNQDEVVPEKKAKETIIGDMQPKKERTMQIKGQETRGKWEEVSEEQSDLFTMDYRRVRRRRPIHNKSLRIP